MNERATDQVVTSDDPEWRDPTVDPPPQGASVFLMTEGGVLVRGVYREDGGYVAWYPFLKKPMWLRQRLDEVFFKNSAIREELRATVNTEVNNPG